MKEFIGKKPDKCPPRTEDFDDLEKKMIDILIDAIKYIATTSGIVIAVYSQILQKYLIGQSTHNSSYAKLILFLPLLFWFIAIIGTVIGIFPRSYKANTDIEKQKAINSIRKSKRFWLSMVLVFFACGFAMFFYIITAQIWHLYPFLSI